MVLLGRLITAMVTPFDNDGGLDYRQARKLASSLLASGSDGLIVSGTTGESPTLSGNEKVRLFREIKAEIGNKGAVIAGTGNYSTQESIDLTKEAEQEGVDACLLVVPYYNKPTQEGLYQHFRAIADRTNLPCILYNVPSRTITSMSVETTLRLAQIENIVGIKEASGDLDQIGKIIDGAPDGFRVWSGNDNDTFAVMSLGGYGIVSVASNLIGDQIKGMMKLILEGNTSEAASEHLRLLPISKGLFVVSNPIPVKFALNQSGFRVGKPRLPLIEPDEGVSKQILDMLSGYTVDIPIPTSI